ncbi:Fucosyltransferase, N-terminal, partial [Halocaridina rubra]
VTKMITNMRILLIFLNFVFLVSVVLIISIFLYPLGKHLRDHSLIVPNDNRNTLPMSLSHYLILKNRSAKYRDNKRIKNYSDYTPSPSPFHNWRNLSQEEIDSLSVLGRRLYLGEDIGQKQEKNFTILFWKTGLVYANRFLYQYGPKMVDPFANCSVNNCEIKYEDNLVDSADAILIHFHRTPGPQSFPKRSKTDQLWIWLTDESPYNTFMIAGHNTTIKDHNGYFNWSMSYRMDSDIPVPYGRTVLMTGDEVSEFRQQNYFHLKKKLIAVMGSNCGGTNNRWGYIRELQKHMDVDTYGNCGSIQACPGGFAIDCKDLNDYKFYIAFENSNCNEYITEKVSIYD